MRPLREYVWPPSPDSSRVRLTADSSHPSGGTSGELQRSVVELSMVAKMLSVPKRQLVRLLKL